jgi:hypothetical protein
MRKSCANRPSFFVTAWWPCLAAWWRSDMCNIELLMMKW